MHGFPFVYPSRPAGAPVFTNSFLTPQEIHFGEAAQEAWQSREIEVSQSSSLHPSDSGSGELLPGTYVGPEPSPQAGRIGRPVTYADFFETCPTRQEVQQLLNDINIEFQPGTGVEKIIKNRKLTGDFVCHGQLTARGPFTLSMVTFVTKAFQTLKWLQFDKPMPIIGPKTPYEWVKHLSIFGNQNQYRIFPYYHALSVSGPPASASTFGSTIDLVIPAPVFNYDSLKAITLASIILHESRHSIAGGLKLHTCNSAWTNMYSGNINLPGFARDDWELVDGASAMNYWFLVWCRHHTTPGTWHPNTTAEGYILKILDNMIQFQWDTWFCTHRGFPDGVDPSIYGPPPLDPSDAVARSVFPDITKPGGQLLSSPFAAPVRMPAVQRTGIQPPVYGRPMLTLPEQPWMTDVAYQQALAQQTGVPWPILEMMAMTI